jgi:hypothetical protein
MRPRPTVRLNCPAVMSRPCLPTGQAVSLSCGLPVTLRGALAPRVAPSLTFANSRALFIARTSFKQGHLSIRRRSIAERLIARPTKRLTAERSTRSSTLITSLRDSASGARWWIDVEADVHEPTFPQMTSVVKMPGVHCFAV